MTEVSGMGTRLTEGEKRERLEEYCAALATVRSARTVFLWLLALSLLVTMGGYSAQRWGKVLDPSTGHEATAASAPSGETPSPGAGTEGAESTAMHNAFRLGLPLAAFLGPVSCALLALSYLVAANVCLSGTLGGARGMIAAFFWALVLLALLFPWGRWLGEASGVPQIPGVYASYDELRHLPETFRDVTHQVLHYLRFLGYPVLALIILVLGNGHFRRGHRQAIRHL